MTTIGVFDSGFGGLTVLRELIRLLPGARFVYLGDTARLPYGAKSQETIARYAVSSAAFLEQQGAEMLVIACNTASALAMEELKACTLLPVLGVIEPGARAALNAGTGDVLVLATDATVQSGAYARALGSLGLRALQKACPLLVPLVEEGWIIHPVTAEVLRIYLSEALESASQQGFEIKTVLLGCTHYPLIRGMIEATLNDLGMSGIRVIDSAESMAVRVAADLPEASEGTGACEFYATDSVSKFERLGSRFLGHPLSGVNLIRLAE